VTALILASVGLERPTADATLSEAFPLIGPENFSGPIAGFPLRWILLDSFYRSFEAFHLKGSNRWANSRASDGTNALLFAFLSPIPRSL